MASYINITFNHFAAIQKWANETGAEATLDMRDFVMEVKHRGRYYRMFPMFQGNVQGRLVHLPQLTPDVRGFGGWRPYQTLTHPYSSDKQLFRNYLREAGLRCAPSWDADGEPPEQDYVLKARSSSFGVGLFGPYHGGTPPNVPVSELKSHGDMFFEQFVPGRMLKVWYWGARPFFAHMQNYPTIVGDGRSTVRELLQEKLSTARLNWDSFDQKAVVLDALAFQGWTMAHVPEPGRSAWIDYRYGQLYEGPSGGTATSDNRLDDLLGVSGDQVHELGRALARLLTQTVPVPVAITVDGMLDAEGNIWWLEMNTNSLLPPEAYAAMFLDLFG